MFVWGGRMRYAPTVLVTFHRQNNPNLGPSSHPWLASGVEPHPGSNINFLTFPRKSNNKKTVAALRHYCFHIGIIPDSRNKSNYPYNLPTS